MACYRPIPARRNETQTLTKGAVTLWPPLGQANLELPCGKCIGCRTTHATHWANRCMSEAQLHQNNIFLTLTYDDEHLPPNSHLNATHLTNFIKRLRKYSTGKAPEMVRNRATSIRYFGCGEYGEQWERPHYHLLLFNTAFKDAYRVGEDLYSSETLSKLWLFGQHKIGNLTGRSANYVARYSVRKQNQLPCDADGVERPRPFLRMSLKPAIGMEWLKKYRHDLADGYMVSHDGKKNPIPRYYTKKIKELDWQLAESIETATYLNAKRTPAENRTPERRRDAEIIHHNRAERDNHPGF